MAKKGPHAWDIRAEFLALRQQIDRLQGRSVDGIKEEILLLAARPLAAFDHRRAVALLETLANQARVQGHPMAEEYEIILQRTQQSFTPDIHEFEMRFPMDPFSAYQEYLRRKVGWITRKRDGRVEIPPAVIDVSREFVSRSIESRITSGAVTIWGRVGSVPPPYLVLPLTVEPSKPRLCPNLRYLNLWMKECPFRLDSVMNLTKYVGRGHFQTKCDDKSGYDHGYFIGLGKCQLDPVQCLEFLGLGADSVLLAFLLPERKKWSFAELRETVLSRKMVSVTTIQKLTGKLVSFGLAVPAARLYCREMFNAIKLALRNGEMVQVKGPVRQELEHWRFLDKWEGHLPWRVEKHEVIELSSDASGFKWAGIVATKEGAMQCSDYWRQDEQEGIIAVIEGNRGFETSYFVSARVGQEQKGGCPCR
ncbi:uncharacterized protein LOC118418268 [Branchiostoma floridae]|uniref:Uncharacterized protein LOC118418268 n=1 Tax=Branchiostoma floridae TaxID=7739 RepID=A0A9J7LCR0_BRAFL|nr:uncharacterized protein LOC118418268 [Branchiostoma floridae]